jgi:hypothetical protein
MLEFAGIPTFAFPKLVKHTRQRRMTEFTTFFLAFIIAGAVFMFVLAFGCKFAVTLSIKRTIQ